MRQSTFDDIRKVQFLEQLTVKQVSIVRLLSTGATQGMISRQLRVSRSSVSQACRLLEENNIIKKAIGERYNILYEIAPQLQKRIGGSTERLSACRVHNIALKFSILKQDHPVSRDKRSGFAGSWFMRGKIEWYKFWYPGKAGEIACTITVYPKTIKIQMDAKQTILAANVEDAEQRGFQHLIHIRQKFIDRQRLFGVNLDIEPTGKRIGKVHGGFAGSAQTSAMREGVTTLGWWIDKSGKGELGEDKLELESYTERGGPTRLDNLIKASEQFSYLPDLPDMIKAAIDPIHADLTTMAAHIAAGTTSQFKINEQNQMILQLLKIVTGLQEEIREMKAQH